MESLLANIKIQVNPKTYVKDPETSTLGKKIVQNSILLIDEIDFENKHNLLVYLTSWYWAWMEYRLVFSTNNIENKLEKLKKAITIVTETIEDDFNTAHINEAILNKIIIEEFTKTLQNKHIDEENKKGFFLIYKQVNYRLEKMIQDINPDYPFAKSLVSNIIEGSLHQHFLKNHLKTITNCNDDVSPTSFYIHLVENLLKN
jgi:hypothetical protein